MGVNLEVRSAAGTRSYPVDRGLTIGRALDNAIVVESIDVSRHHATISPAPSGFVYVDLGSANGTRLNGAEVEPRVPTLVRPGDILTIADVTLALTDSSAPIPAPQAPAASPRPGATVMAEFPRAFLDVTTPAGTREVALEGAEITIGREPDNRIVIPEDVVSRHHLVLRQSAGTYVASDLGTTNGIAVGGVRVASHPMQSGDVVAIGDTVTLRFRVGAAAVAGQRPETPQDQELRLGGRQSVTVGRAPDCDLVLSHPTVSQHHARISISGPQRVIEDLGSTNGTFVNGMRLARGESRVLTASDVIQLGPVRLHLGAEAIRSQDQSQHIRLTAMGLNQRVRQDLNLLKNISVVIEPQEFVAVVGVSGSGKSTLLGALSGLRPATDGDVVLNDTSLYDHFEAFRTTLGYVPQDDILHKELPVARALEYSAQLRLPDDTSEQELHQRVEAVLQTLGLQERRDTSIGALSGGQRKRVSIGAELLTQPGLFFLDEATSGLDPGTESQLMRLLRKLADDGHTILLITHATKNVMMCDQVLFLAKGGFLAYFGPPDQALSYFGVQDFDGIYEKLESSERKPEEWGAAYLRSTQYQQYVMTRLASQQQSNTQRQFAGGGQAALPPTRTSSAMRQLRVLSTRYFELIRRDRVNFGLMFLLAPLLGLIDLIAWKRDVLDYTKGDSTTAMTMFFLSALIPFLIGALSAVREIVKEAPIYARERAVSLKIWPYLGSKVAIAALFALYHAGTLTLIKLFWIDFPGVELGGFIQIYVTVFLAVVSGAMFALLISALTKHEEQAMMLMIGLIVLQVVFSGGLLPLSSLGPAGTVLGGITSTAWTFKALTAAAGISVQGCSPNDLMANCHLPGFGPLPPDGRVATYDQIDRRFGGVFDADVLTCWAAMLALIAALGLLLYLLQKRKDTL